MSASLPDFCSNAVSIAERLLRPYHFGHLRLTISAFSSIGGSFSRQWKMSHGRAARAPEARDEDARLSDGAEEPADVIFVGPIGDADLVAGEKTERGADAMDRRPVIEMLEQIVAELVLHPAADRDHDMLRALSPNEREEVSSSTGREYFGAT